MNWTNRPVDWVLVMERNGVTTRTNELLFSFQSEKPTPITKINIETGSSQDINSNSNKYDRLHEIKTSHNLSTYEV